LVARSNSEIPNRDDRSQRSLNFSSQSMSATISEPFLLSSYGLSKNLPNCVGELKRGSSYVHSTHENGSKNSDGSATITVHGDGVHVLDVSLMLEIAAYNF
jgi:hypothetical protein